MVHRRSWIVVSWIALTPFLGSLVSSAAPGGVVIKRANGTIEGVTGEYKVGSMSFDLPGLMECYAEFPAELAFASLAKAEDFYRSRFCRDSLENAGGQVVIGEYELADPIYLYFENKTCPLPENALMYIDFIYQTKDQELYHSFECPRKDK